MGSAKKLALIAVVVIIIGAFLLSPLSPLSHSHNQIFEQIFKSKNEKVITDYVISVHDGDTIRTQNLSESIRLLYIDTPEVPPAVRKAQFGGYEARDFLKAEILHKYIKLKCKGKDKYGRNLCEIYPINASTEDIKNSYNYQLVALGYACPFMTHNHEIIKAGIEARDKRTGIFSDNSTYKCREKF